MVLAMAIKIGKMSLIVRWLILSAFYLLFYTSFNANIRGIYSDKEAADGYEYTNHYYVPESVWRKRRFFGFLLRKSNAWERYPDSESGVKYYEYRQLQSTVIARLAAFAFFLADTALFICKSDFTGLGLLVWIPLCTAIEIILSHPIMKRDVRRIKSYQYIVAENSESIVSETRGKLPALWKINTLLDVFFYFGEARIRYCETQNYLVYRLKDGKLLYIFLKDSFATMPEEDLSHYDGLSNTKVFQHYNPAMAIWVDDCVCVDGRSCALTGKTVLPQDMPERIF